MYKERNWGKEKVGEWSENGKIAIEFDLSGIKIALGMEEAIVKASRGRYGRLVDNPKLRMARALGNPENVLGNFT